MELDEQPRASTSQEISSENRNVEEQLDLVGGPFAVIESDPGVFTSLTRKLGVRNIELVELYDIEPWAVDHLNPHGLIFCFLWHKDSHRPADFEDPTAERVWFANQLSDDACASHAILNVLLNCPDVDIGDTLRAFKRETEKMSPVMKGLAITNSPLLRRAHNSLARPADLRTSLNAIAITTLDDAKSKLKASKAKPKTTPKRGTKPPPTKRAKTSKSPKKGKDEAEEEKDEEEVYHFIGYVPAYGKVWELDGLKSGPLEVGELSGSSGPSGSAPSRPERSSISTDWMSVARPALRMKMEKYGGSAEGGSNIRFSLLAIVDGLYEQASDDLELLKRERVALEKRLGTGWEEKIDPALLESAEHIHETSFPRPDMTYATDFGARKMAMNIKVLNMPEQNLVPAWELCLQNTLRAKVTVEDEIAKAVRANTDHVRRTFDYEPFFKEFVEKLHTEGLLNALLGLDKDGTKAKTGSNAVKKATTFDGKIK